MAADFTWTASAPDFCAQHPTDPACSFGHSTGKTLQSVFANAATGGTWTTTNTGIIPPGFPTFPTIPATTTTTPGTVPGQVVNVTTPTPLASPWYKTWWGIGALAAVGLYAASKLMKKKA